MQYNTPMLDARNTAVCGRYNAYIKAVATVDSPPTCSCCTTVPPEARLHSFRGLNHAALMLLATSS